MSKNKTSVAFTVLAFTAAFSLVSCGSKTGDGEAVSIESLYEANGSPVAVRTVAHEDFSAYRKYATVLQASSESTAYSITSDVVRKINRKIGDTVARDEIVISFSEDNQNYQQALVAFEAAKSVFDRINALYKASDVSKQDYESAKTQYDLAKARLDAASDLVFARAPIAGKITSINVHQTENVRPGTVLFTVSGASQDAGFEGRFYVGEDEIDDIKSGARVFIDRDKRVEGSVTQVSLIMDPIRQSFPVTAFFPMTSEQGSRLVSGMAVDLSVEIYRNEKALVVSRRELVISDSGYTAFLAVNDAAQPVNIAIGREQGLRYEVKDGLCEGDLLITEGAQRLQAGTPINTVSEVAVAKK
jgi:RND family efflux transporter MFP subunit